MAFPLLLREQRRKKAMDHRFLNAKEVAALLGVSVRTICDWAVQYRNSGGKEGIPAYCFGKRAWSFDRHEIQTWIAKRKVKAA
jgi:predicted DNA-binding transcriptional regulator AlpA